MAALAHSHRYATPTAQDASLARVSGQRLSPYVQRKKPLSLKVTEAGQEQPIELPAGAVVLPDGCARSHGGRARRDHHS